MLTFWLIKYKMNKRKYTNIYSLYVPVISEKQTRTKGEGAKHEV